MHDLDEVVLVMNNSFWKQAFGLSHQGGWHDKVIHGILAKNPQHPRKGLWVRGPKSDPPNILLRYERVPLSHPIEVIRNPGQRDA